MKTLFRPFLLIALALTLGLPGLASAESISVWPVDVHEKIFSDAAPREIAPLTLSAASNEYESAQFALRCDEDAPNLSIAPSNLICEASGAKIGLENIRIRRIEPLHITKNTPDADDIVVRKAPCDIPEILYDESVVSLKANETLGIWVTLRVPKGTPAGEYKGSIYNKSDSVSFDLPVALTVFAFELPDTRHLYMTNWWSAGNVAKYHNVEYMSDDFWALIEKYFKNMGEHRQNVVILPWIPGVGSFIDCVHKKDGTFEYDFANFEKILKLAEENGVAERIELSHIGGIDRTSHTINFSSATIYDEKEEAAINFPIDVWLEPALKALCDYLKKTGRLERAMLHVSDEPYLPDIEAWREASERVRKIAPELKQIDAIETMNFSNRLDVWVPKLSHFDRWRKGFEQRRGDNEYWYYICCHPVGPNYPNRFMDLPAARLRVLHWINYSEDLVGYLHWGFNYWQGEAFGPPTEKYGPGDTHLVYPGPNGPLDSIRWELERESAEDYEYLKLLEESVANIKSELDPEKAWFLDSKGRTMELARRIVPDLVSTTMDASLIEKTRQDLANEIVAAASEPKLVVQTFPEDGKTIYSGPNLVELYGAATPGSKVTINDEEVPVAEDGFFKKLFYADAKGELNVVVRAVLGDKAAQTTRHFVIK